jgi:hypothetical protein
VPHDQVPVDPGTLEYPVGADPEAGIGADVDWPQHPFPPSLDLPDVPAPVDGYPWSDPHLLGAAVPDGAVDGGDGTNSATGEPHEYRTPSGDLPEASPPVGDLYEYAGEADGGDGSGGDGPAGGWPELIASEDPATGALARWWAPRS